MSLANVGAFAESAATAGATKAALNAKAPTAMPSALLDLTCMDALPLLEWSPELVFLSYSTLGRPVQEIKENLLTYCDWTVTFT